jgi:hypothetical protein
VATTISAHTFFAGRVFTTIDQASRNKGRGMLKSADVPVAEFYNGKPITADEWKILKLVNHWQFFISPTFVKLGTRSWRVQRINNWLRWVAHQGKTTKRYLIYAIRWEHGEIGGRPHPHLFVGGMKGIYNEIGLCHALAAEWKRRHASRIDVRVFERSLVAKGANYVAGAPRSDWDWGKNRYEIGKFGKCGYDNVHFSQRAEEVLQQMSGAAAA